MKCPRVTLGADPDVWRILHCTVTYLRSLVITCQSQCFLGSINDNQIQWRVDEDRTQERTRGQRRNSALPRSISPHTRHVSWMRNLTTQTIFILETDHNNVSDSIVMMQFSQLQPMCHSRLRLLSENISVMAHVCRVHLRMTGQKTNYSIVERSKWIITPVCFINS